MDARNYLTKVKAQTEDVRYTKNLKKWATRMYMVEPRVHFTPYRWPIQGHELWNVKGDMFIPDDYERQRLRENTAMSEFTEKIKHFPCRLSY